LKALKYAFVVLSLISASAFAAGPCAKYVSVREYDNNKDNAEVARIAQKEFLPLMQKLPGFIGWELITVTKKKLITITSFDNKESMDESVKTAKEWGKKALTHLVIAPAEINNGEVIATSCQ
jgi:hypothetical protein